VTSDKLLFTPGPLTTSRTVKEAMLRDLGSRDEEFLNLVLSIRKRVGQIAAAGQGYTVIPMQGSGTFAVESVVSSVIPADGGLLVLVNGSYSERIARMAAQLKIPVATLRCAENENHSAAALEKALRENSFVTHVAVVHCETTSGVLNPISDYGRVTASFNRGYIVDAMSSFGALPIRMADAHIDFLISSANKCIEGVPGFAFVVAREQPLQDSAGWARSMSLDLFAQWKGLEESGQFRFTPPTHALLAFAQALQELDAEGGVQGRHARYVANHRTLVDGMEAMGFRAYVPARLQAPIITTFHYPAHPGFRFEEFYRGLSGRGFVIYPGKLTQLDCFRIGNIGRLYPHDMTGLLGAVREVLGEMKIPIPVT